ncbi:hypothetical protein [Gimesia aquarii]|uniref:Uncharacterized protein n=1 Tax=Gimesia aquarii TaxID=2527964 RepID=A0A517WTE0_9PLAN|nr:hypothetical protein [Gimesia aquarii]QDU08498.1 hypothetical protein V202x_18670 [Gimesia aquarii]
MGQIVEEYERGPRLDGALNLETPDFKFDKKGIFLRETKQFPCLRQIPELCKLAEAVVASWYLEPTLTSSRAWHRISFERPIGLAFVDEKTKQLESELQTVEGRNLSIEGISFAHSEPIYSREVAIALDLEKPTLEFLVTRLAWSRFSEAQLFQSGGKFIRQVEVDKSHFEL